MTTDEHMRRDVMARWNDDACRAHPDDCPNGPEPHIYHPPELEGLPCCRQPGEEVPSR